MVYVALLRGINVGGNNIIKMIALREAFEALGFADVATYIQSGNVIFSAAGGGKKALTATIEAALAKAFSYESKVVVISAKELAAVVAEAPRGFGTQKDRYRYDVLFLKPPLTPKQALAALPRAPGVDDVHAGKHAIYYRRLEAEVTRSRISKVAAMPIYKSMTVRNWNTTVKLNAMAGG